MPVFNSNPFFFYLSHPTLPPPSISCISDHFKVSVTRHAALPHPQADSTDHKCRINGFLLASEP